MTDTARLEEIKKLLANPVAEIVQMVCDLAFLLAERDAAREALKELEAAISNWRTRSAMSKTDEAQAQTRLNMARAKAGEIIRALGDAK